MLNKNQNIKATKEESVEELLSKLAKKGKKVKLLDETGSVKELPRQEDDSDFNDREPPSSMKKKLNKIRETREVDESDVSA